MTPEDRKDRTIYYWAVRTGMLMNLCPGEPELPLALLLGCRQLGLEPAGEVLALMEAYARSPDLKPQIQHQLESLAVQDRMRRRAERIPPC